jgi:hypothetical protein
MQKHRGSLVWLIAWLSLGSAVWLASPRSAQNHAKANATSLSAISDKKPSQEDRLSSSGKRLKSIERVEVGQRVATGISQEIRDLAIGDPLAVPQWDRIDHEIDSETWRKLTLVMHTPQGDRFDITLLRPIGWLESCNARVGSSIHLVVSEQGLDGLADVLAIEPCPRIYSGVGRVVTGTFTHVRGGILRIRLAGLAEPLGVTSNHSIYSADRLDFVPAGELRVGDTLRNLDGDVRIESIEQLGSEERVYNLEIHGEHVFRVASSGLLVHNSSVAQGSNGGVPGAYRPSRPLPRDQHGNMIPDSRYPHTQLGTEKGRKVGVYTAAREFGENGQWRRDIHFTDHGRPQNHTNPHQHLPQPQPTGGTPGYGPPVPFDPYNP